jgi:hypothetical protein
MFWKEEEGNSRLFNRFLEQLEKLAENYSLSYFLIFAIGGNIAIWLLVLFFPSYVYNIVDYSAVISDKLRFGLMGIPLLFGTFIAYFLFRLKFPDIEEQNLESEIMSTYSFQTNASKRWKIWIASITIGIINTALLILTDLSLTNN